MIFNGSQGKNEPLGFVEVDFFDPKQSDRFTLAVLSEVINRGDIVIAVPGAVSVGVISHKDAWH